MTATRFAGRALVHGSAAGPVLHSHVPLSVWGGVDPRTGRVVDRLHPLCGESLAGRVLAIPGSRGSCSGSGVMLELILGGLAPAALVFEHGEEILPLGVIVAEEMFGRSLPVVTVGPEVLASLARSRWLRVAGATIDDVGAEGVSAGPLARAGAAALSGVAPSDGVALSEEDRAMLAGEAGEAAAAAMRIVLRMAAVVGADRLIDVTRAHLDGCLYTGPGGLRVAEEFRDRGGRVRVPTTLNAVSVDCRRWREMGVAEAVGAPATRLAEAYVGMGARPTFTCAPYLLDSGPALGEQIAWAESNAVVFANSVLGARTMKYPDFLDLCIALTGRAPRAGCHVPAQRRATLRIQVEPVTECDESFYPLVGYLAGSLAGAEIPLVAGLEDARPTLDDLKAFGAAFATTSAAPMFHVAGVTPEAASALGPDRPVRTVTVSREALAVAWGQLNSAGDSPVDLVAIGTPHASVEELARLAALCRDRSKRPGVALVVTSGRSVLERAEQAGVAAELRAFGADLVADTCWCMLGAPVVSDAVRAIMTNSAKYAHYAPGLVGRPTRFGSLADCVEAACAGRVAGGPPAWLRGGPRREGVDAVS